MIHTSTVVSYASPGRVESDVRTSLKLCRLAVSKNSVPLQPVDTNTQVFQAISITIFLMAMVGGIGGLLFQGHSFNPLRTYVFKMDVLRELAGVYVISWKSLFVLAREYIDPCPNRGNDNKL